MKYDKVNAQALRRMRKGDVTVFQATDNAQHVTSFQHRAGGKFKQETVIATNQMLQTIKLLIIRCVVPAGG